MARSSPGSSKPPEAGRKAQWARLANSMATPRRAFDASAGCLGALQHIHLLEALFLDWICDSLDAAFGHISYHHGQPWLQHRP